MKKVESVLVVLVMLVAVPCLAFEGYQGHEGQIPLCQNKRTGKLRFAPMKDIDRTTKVDYEPYCSTLTETIIWINIQGIQGPQGPPGPQGPKGDPTYVSTVVVSPVGNETQNGTALLSALSGITASSTNRFLLKIEPGIYDIGTQSLQMKEYVDIEGSGETTTIIKGHIGFSWTGIVRGANNAEIRLLAINNMEGTPYSCAVMNVNVTASFKMTNVTTFASGGLFCYSVYNHKSSPTMKNVTATAFGGTNNMGVVSDTSSPTMTNVTISASGGKENYGVFTGDSGTVRIYHSVISATTATIYNHDYTTTLLANTQLDGGPAQNEARGTLTCVGAYDGNYNALNTSCQ